MPLNFLLFKTSGPAPHGFTLLLLYVLITFLYSFNPLEMLNTKECNKTYFAQMSKNRFIEHAL